MNFVLRTGFLTALAATTGLSLAQTNTIGLSFECHLGSFKLIRGKGKAEFSFSGTVLLADFKGKESVSGNVKVEYDDKAKHRKAYFGKGKITVDGEWSGIQAFGSDFKGRFVGVGFMRMVGEFDKNMKTGTYWYDDEPTDVRAWYTSTFTVAVPPPREYGGLKPKRRGGG